MGSPTSSARRPSALRIGVLSALFITLTVGCGGTDGARGAAGASGLDSPDFTISPTAETVYTVGALEGEPWETFGRVSNIAFDADGNLFILDRDAAHVVVIDPQGGHLRVSTYDALWPSVESTTLICELLIIIHQTPVPPGSPRRQRRCDLPLPWPDRSATS